MGILYKKSIVSIYEIKYIWTLHMSMQYINITSVFLYLWGI